MVNAGIIICSDKCSVGERLDTAGTAARELLESINIRVEQYKIIPDDKKQISDILCDWSDNLRLELILTAGGTGFAARDVTPEATRAVIEREAPGLPELMRAAGYKLNKHAILSRAVAGIRKNTLIVNLPGSEKAVRESLGCILSCIPHALEILNGKTEHNI